MKSITANEGSEITLEANEFTKTGYTFSEWNTKADGKGEKFTDKAKIKLTANTTLYAQWTANKYTVKFDKNADDATDAMESQTFTYGTPQALSENKFTRTGYDFVGWATSLDGKVTYNDKQDYSIGAENVTLYAKWVEKDKVAKVTFSYAGGEIDSGDTVTLSCATEDATIYYVFVSGTQTPDLTNKQKYDAPITITDNITIAAIAVKDGMNQSDLATATFTVKTYTVTFSTAHGTAPEKITGLKKGSKLTSEQLPTLTATGYTFDGWYNGETQFTTESEITADITLTAKWDANTYTVKFDANGGTGSMTAQNFTYGTSQALSENKFIRTGYNFAGWATSADGEVAYKDKQDYSIGAENVTLYAKWEAIEYKITYENTENATNDNPTLYTIEDSITLKEPTKDDYTFDGWYETSNFSGTAVTSWYAGEKTEAVTLYAKWLVADKFIKVQGVPINGSETWTPASEVFVSGRVLDIKAFYMSDHEVTRGEYKKIMGSDPSTARAHDKDGNVLTGNAADNNPVNYVKWYDAIVYCNRRSIKEDLTPCYKINGSTDPTRWGEVPTSSDDAWKDSVTCDWTANGYRLPTEAEWEWAARGGQNYKYAGSDDINEVAWYTGNMDNTGTREVKTKKSNGYGLYDMSGNVWEWCWDWYSDSISTDTPAAGALSGDSRCQRGGGWNEDVSYVCKVDFQFCTYPDARYRSYGFRVVRTAE